MKSPEHTQVLGMGLGASTISLVLLEIAPGATLKTTSRQSIRIRDIRSYPHEGAPRRTLLKALEDINPQAIDRLAVTGRRFRRFLNLSDIPEPQAVEYAYRFLKPRRKKCNAIVSAGGETFMVYVLDAKGRIANVITGNKCASGTGEFFLQQLRRMDTTLEEAAQWAAVEIPYAVSGRCSVFCKSDCTHATNKGIPRSRVTAGLCKMMAGKILELLKRVPRKNIMLVGGAARNQMMVAYLKEEIQDLIVPEQAHCFEALGAALWAAENQTQPFPDMDHLFRSGAAAFSRFQPLKTYDRQVTFKTMARDKVRSGDVCILGLDVGSTTTKAVLIREADNALLASEYLRTGGDPVAASRKCYQSLYRSVKAVAEPGKILIRGLGVCGSGRQIAGLHALTDMVINEIIAHAAAAVHFDPKVDTLFEIGGQDAKYTYITNSVPCDYAMNEACSAGTGSFLEESAWETLGLAMTDIADIAIKAEDPPNFNDQCAAFIASDIKNAIHEGMSREDIVAGLVYSICLNYVNRVKGNRPVGERIFMQGGVCYNHAVPLAMAAVAGKPIIVPPEPGLMGAFGVALEVKQRLAMGLCEPGRFDLETLIQREVEYGKSFICPGGKEKCDRGCEIAMILIEGRKYPFGGACNRYYNLRRKIKTDPARLDLVRKRQQMIFDRAPQPPRAQKRIGLNRSFMVNTYLPLYDTFFKQLGLETRLPARPSRRGMDKREAAFCYPAELAHGFFDTLIADKALDHLFLPHFKAIPTAMAEHNAQVCPFAQGEPFYLKTAFADQLAWHFTSERRIFSPLIDLTKGLAAVRPALVRIARELGAGAKHAHEAVDAALAEQNRILADMKTMGRNFLTGLEKTSDQIAVVVFGRAYNAFADEAHMGIPHKLATRGVPVIPFDLLNFDLEPAKTNMYWGAGQQILKAARLVKAHPQLFGLYITNFSCGPDSFLIGYFRDIMGRKPSLTLELDSHTADAGLETRIEAFLDIVAAYRRMPAAKAAPRRSFIPAHTIMANGRPEVVSSSGNRLAFDDPRVTLLIPSMGRYSSDALAAVFRGTGFNAVAHPPADEAILKLGRANTTCKECLPLILTTGALLNYAEKARQSGEVLVYFMATTSGPCRFGQYAVFMQDLIQKREMRDVALFSMSSENAYGGLRLGFEKMAWWAIVVSDIMEDIRAMLLANARDVDHALMVFHTQWENLLDGFEAGSFRDLEARLYDTARALGKIPLLRPVAQVPKISLVGEIYVRRDALSRRFITETLAQKGFAVQCAPVAEWILYSDYLVNQGLNTNGGMSPMKRLKFKLARSYKLYYEARIKSIIAESGLVTPQPVDIPAYLQNAGTYISPNLTGEAILTIGSALTEVVSHTCGVIAIGPFGCMPNRLAEAILNRAMTARAKLALAPENHDISTVLADLDDLPFLAIESDGAPFPQLIDSKLETFCLRAERLHERLQARIV